MLPQSAENSNGAKLADQNRFGKKSSPVTEDGGGTGCKSVSASAVSA